eukprot:GILK01003129.1.p1 GENE.GILK01003129.1~~GILK01003129.1.p1  ORF type:complete len:284 (-),score=76.02 GILK01003129.1:176-979(-)
MAERKQKSKKAVEAVVEPKRQKKNETNSHEQAEVPYNLLEQLEQVQQEVGELDEKYAEEIIELEKRINKLKEPHFKRRSDILRKIDLFWKTVLIHHPTMRNLLTASDMDALDALQDITIEDHNESTGFKLLLHFKPNPYFTDAVLWKDYTFDDEMIPSATASGINWKPGKNFTQTSKKVESKKGKRTHEEMEVTSFFSLFTEGDPLLDDSEIADIFRTDIYPDPVKYYFGDVDSDDDALLAEMQQEDDDEDDDNEDDEGHDEEDADE